MRKRVDQIGVAEPSLQRSGADQIDVSLPDVKNADEAASQVGTTAQMWFYDWEGSVLGPNCKPDPQNAEGDRRAGGRRSPASRPRCRSSTPSRAARSARAPTRARSPRATSSTSSTRRRKKVLAGPDESRADLQKRGAATRRSPSTPSRSSRCRRASSSSAPSRTTPRASRRPAWYVLKDQPILGGTDIKNPEQNFDNGPGESGQPNVTLRLHRPRRERVGEVHAQALPARPGVRARRVRATRPTSTSRSRSTTS